MLAVGGHNEACFVCDPVKLTVDVVLALFQVYLEMGVPILTAGTANIVHLKIVTIVVDVTQL